MKGVIACLIFLKSLFLFSSVLWVIPRLDLIVQWIFRHIWQSAIIGGGILGIFIFMNWIKQKRADRKLFLKEQPFNVEKSEG